MFQPLSLFCSFFKLKTIIITCTLFTQSRCVVLLSPPWLDGPLWNICFTNDHGYVPLVVSTSRSFPHLWLITGFVTRLTWRVPLVEQELSTLPEHLSSPNTLPEHMSSPNTLPEHMSSPNTIPSTWVHPRFLVGFVLLDL